MALASLFALFAVSGAAGLIYQSVWSHYLRLFLGHAAYAQALVLVIFMGGLALGAWLAGRWLPRVRHLLLAYAAVELVIGVLGIGFHGVFTRVLAWAFADLLPALGSGAAGELLRWLLAGALVLPQAVLLGATFPLMSNGVMRAFPGTPGASVAMLYFSNSAGAAAGVIASGFLLIPAVGYPGTVLAAGLLNVLVAVLVYAIVGRAAGELPRSVEAPAAALRGVRVLLLVAALTGAASFIYEIAWIRMLSMVFGASNHAFELMLCAFIAGLALGGLWIRGRVDRLRSPLMFLAWVQVAMGVTAALTIPLYNQLFDLMASLMQALARTDSGFVLYTLLRGAVAVLVMLPTTFLAGTTLPLLTRLLLDHGQGERSVSHVYAANTVGAIAGVLFAVGIGLPVLGLERLLAAGALLDIALGAVLMLTLGGVLLRRPVLFAAGGAAGAVALLVLMVDFDPRRMASAVYREGVARLPEATQMLLQRDGRTATIALWREGPNLLLATNGKPDASIAMAPDAEPTLDDITQTLLGALPLALHPGATRAAVIGMGSGASSAVLLGSPAITRLDTIEIEREVVNAARHFQPHNTAVFEDPRSHILVEDAKRVFATRRAGYDIIVSEPSNPWVSGVASLFSREFYATLAASLADGGLLVQWLQLYEIDRMLVASVLKALAQSFDDYHLYAAHDGDLLVIASPRGKVPEPGAELFAMQPVAQALARVGIESTDDLRVRWLGSRALLGTLLETPSVAANSDYFPVLDTHAPRALFKRANVQDLARYRASALPLADLLAPRLGLQLPAGATRARNHAFSARLRAAHLLLAYFDAPDPTLPALGFNAPAATLAWQLAGECAPNADLWLTTTMSVSIDTAAYLSAADGERLWQHLASRCATPVPAWREQWYELFRATAIRDSTTMAANAAGLLEDAARWDGAQRQHLLGALVLALIAEQRLEEAAQHWLRHREAVFGPATPPLDLLLLESLLPLPWGTGGS